MELLKIIYFVVGFALIISFVGYELSLIVPESKKKHSIKRMNRLFAKHLAMAKQNILTDYTSFKVERVEGEKNTYNLIGTYELKGEVQTMEGHFQIANGLSLSENILYQMAFIIGHDNGEVDLIKIIEEEFEGNYKEFLEIFTERGY